MRRYFFLVLLVTSQLWAGGAPPGTGGGWYREVKHGAYDQWVRVDAEGLKLIDGKTLILETLAAGLGATGHLANLKRQRTSSAEAGFRYL